MGKKKKEQDAHPRGLYEVFIVDPQTNQTRKIEAIIADSSVAAREFVNKLPAVAENPSMYDIIVRYLGAVRPKEDLPPPTPITIVKKRLEDLGMLPA